MKNVNNQQDREVKSDSTQKQAGQFDKNYGAKKPLTDTSTSAPGQIRQDQAKRK